MAEVPAISEDYTGIRAEIVALLQAARAASVRSVNALMTATYWEIGRWIAKFEQSGEQPAEYGEQLIEELARDLTRQFGRGFGRANLWQIRAFYQAWPSQNILQTPSGESGIQQLSSRFPLPWFAYIRLLSVKRPEARSFYETEALRSGWSIRQLNRQRRRCRLHELSRALLNRSASRLQMIASASHAGRSKFDGAHET